MHARLRCRHRSIKGLATRTFYYRIRLNRRLTFNYAREALWVYLYRAVDKAGKTADFFLSRTRDVNAAKSFLRSAMKNTRAPTKITLEAYAASHNP